MDEDERLKQQQAIGVQTPDLLNIGARPQQGAALPPAQGGPSLTPAEMQTLSGGGTRLPARETPARPREMRFDSAPVLDLDSLRKELDVELSSLNTREALDQAVQSIDRGVSTIPKNDAEPSSESSWNTVQPASDTVERVPSAQDFTKRGREFATRRMQDRLFGVVRRRKPMSDEAAEKDPETFRFPTLEEMDADTPMPW